jgi:uncharacterized protein with GYD domain
MPTFVLLTKLAPGSLHDARGRRSAGKDWLHKVKECCPDVKWVAHYATLGPYDFMDIYEAPDVETTHKVSLLSRADNAVTVESWAALPYERFLHVIESLTK